MEADRADSGGGGGQVPHAPVIWAKAPEPLPPVLTTRCCCKSHAWLLAGRRLATQSHPLSRYSCSSEWRKLRSFHCGHALAMPCTLFSMIGILQCSSCNWRFTHHTVATMSAAPAAATHLLHCSAAWVNGD